MSTSSPSSATGTRRLGFIGLGLMGRGLATSAARAGHALALLLRHEADTIRCSPLLEAGALAAPTPAALAAQAEVLLLCVTGAPQVEELVFGANGLLGAVRPGTVVVDCSTSLPQTSQRVADALRGRGADFIDAAMTGTPVDAEAGQVNLLLGGRADTMARLRPLLQSFAKNLYLCGDVGAGHTVKLLHQSVVLGNAAVLAEAFALARKAGVDLSTLGDVIGSGGANSTAFQRLRPYVDSGQDQHFRFTLNNALKDMRYYAQMAAQLGAVAGVSGSVLAAYTTADNLGFGGAFVPHLIDSASRLNGLGPD